MADNPIRDEWLVDEGALRAAREELASVGSVRSVVEGRIASTRMKASTARVGGTIAACVVIVACIVVSALRPNSSTSPRFVAIGTGDAVLRVDGAELTEHVAALLDGSRVLVIWSTRGEAAADGSEDANGRVGRYSRRVLRRTTLPDGGTLTCALFVADEQVRPAAEPPFIVATRPGGASVALSTWPRRMSAEQAIESVRASGMGGPAFVRDLSRQIDAHIR